ncbi:MAG TPA: NAD-dependent epimerase/dehydratase family protein [Vicinamibacterales bacterium]|nr:NAD-dependent epimerase/dehydratase family protein [Vicinamibacterales bacterium]
MELKDSRIAVIGGAGFIGSHIIDQLLQTQVREIVIVDNFVRGTRANIADALKDPRVRLVEGSITDRPLMDKVLHGVDGLFLLAALWLYECVHEPRKALEVNVDGTWNVIEAARAAGIKRIVYSSSASVYGDALTLPMTEDHPFNNRTMYGATKIAAEQFLRSQYEQHRLPYVAMRYMNVYGPRMDYKGTYVSVIMKVLDKIDAGERPVVFGDGSQAYDFVHVADVARANVLALQRDVADESFNVGTGVQTTINELVSELLDITASSLTIDYRPNEQMFVTNRVGSTEKAQRLLGFTATTPLKDGLRSVVEWRARDRHAAAPR